MTTQTNPSSPFQDNKKSQPVPAMEFSIRTMQDDLDDLQKNGIPAVEKNVATEAMKIAEEPMATATPPAKPEELFSQAENPFDKKPSPAPAAIERVMPQQEESFSAPFAQKEEKLVEVPMPKKESSSSNATTQKIVFAFIILLVFSIAGLGLYYFLMTRTPEQVPVPEPVSTVEEPVAVQQPTTEQEPVIIAPEEKYSPSKPNYLVLDLARIGADDIKKSLTETALELETATSRMPYEFIIVDANNNPIAFPIFATAAKLNFSPTLLSSLDKEFSLFIYNDTGKSRLGISVDILKESTLTTELKKQEKTLVSDISTLFLNSVPEIKSGAFNTTTYNNTLIHYLNVNQQKDLSVDYAIVNSKLLVSTSKNIQEALVDQMPKKETTAAETQEASNTTGQIIETESVL